MAIYDVKTIQFFSDFAVILQDYSPLRRAARRQVFMQSDWISRFFAGCFVFNFMSSSESEKTFMLLCRPARLRCEREGYIADFFSVVSAY